LIHRLLGEVIDELELRDRLVGICPVGCSVVAYNYFDFDMVEVAHGRAPAVATGIRRVRPDRMVFTYQGDGDLAAIGIAEIVHAAARGEAISVFFVNNATYGMTGGQMAPTTLPGQRTTTSPFGRDTRAAGYPLRVCELLASLPGAAYLERTAINNPGNIRRTRKAIKKSFQIQLEQRRFSLVEILSPCPAAWRMTPLEALTWLEEHMMTYYHVGVVKDETAGATG
jgi:2-oxoglutarate ferredoxin oxidoreductase subunit beta